MGMRQNINLLLLTIIVTVFACKKPYLPAVITTPNSYLVVEGVLNAGNDSTKIKLSTTTALSDTTKTKPESGAKLYVEDDAGARHNLNEAGNGFYISPVLGIQNAQKCRLHITTAKGKEYVSDFVTVDQTPPIDSIPYKEVGAGLQFNVFAHDATNKVRYFRWDFTETYVYLAYLQSNYKYQNDNVVRRVFPADDIYHCYNTVSSAQVLLASTSGLSNSVINGQSLSYVPTSSGKLARGYSMLLKQYALSKDGFEYWQKLKKNTEQLGSIFDAQPSDLRGNLHAVADTNEPVLGFISASTISTKRIIIDPHNLSLYSMLYYGPPESGDCMSGSILINPSNSYSARLKARVFKGDSILVEAIQPAGSPLLGYTIAPVECADCRAKIKTGTNVKPSYWPANLQ